MHFELGWFFTWTIFAIGTFAGWFNPFIGLMVYYALAILRPPFLWFWAFDYFNPPRLSIYVGISTLIGWTLAGFGDWGDWKWIKWPMLGLVLYLLSGLFAAEFCRYNSELAWNFLDNQLKIGLMAVVTVTLIRKPLHVRIFAWVVVLALAYLGESFNEWYRQSPRYLWENGWGGIDNNGVAMVMVMGVPLAFFMMIHDKRWWMWAILFVGTGAMVHVVLFSFSRGGQLGLCMVGVVLFIVALVSLPRKILTVCLAIVFVAIALRLAGHEVRERFWTIFADRQEMDASAASRYVTWSAAWACVKDHPLGVGPRNFNLISAQYGLPGNKSVHNLFLQTAADYGIMGAIGLFVFYIGTAIECFSAARTRTAQRLRWPRYHCHMVVVSLVGFLVCSQFIGMESVETGFIISLLGLCTVACIRRLAAAEPTTESGQVMELEELADSADEADDAYLPAPDLLPEAA